MDEQRRSAVISTISALNTAGSATTRTHIQKMLFFGESWQLLPKLHEWVLHLHGPYSFDLDRDIAELEAFDLVRAEVHPSGYGARYSAQGNGSPPPSAAASLAAWLGPKSTRALESLATCEWVAQQADRIDVDRVLLIKPHLSRTEVVAAADELSEKRSQLLSPL